MKITMAVKEVALNRILHRHDVTRENSRIGLAELKAEWAKTGLRTSDLADVLAEYWRHGVFVHEEYDGQKGMALTAFGLDYLSAGSRRLRDRMAEAMAHVTLTRVASRTASRAALRSGRRAGDPAVDARAP